MSKRIVIIAHDGGELANQLWNHVSILAYACEVEYRCINHSFFEHARSFARVSEGSVISSIFSVPYILGMRLRKSSAMVRVWRKLYKLCVVIPVTFFKKDRIVYSNEEGAVYYLPPTIRATTRLSLLEAGGRDIFMASVNGGVFRDPEGLKKHRQAIVSSLAPADWVRKRIDMILLPLRSRYRHVIGVHIRQTDYKTFKDGAFFVSPERAREIMKQFLDVTGKKPSETCFLIASDERVDLTLFAGLNVLMPGNDVVTDLFMLASCDTLIGSDSTLSHFAAYYGNIPHIIMKNEDMDWEYYRGKDTYFVNKYLTIMRY